MQITKIAAGWYKANGFEIERNATGARTFWTIKKGGRIEAERDTFADCKAYVRAA